MVVTSAQLVITVLVPTPNKLRPHPEPTCLILVTQAHLEPVQEALIRQLIVLPALKATIASTTVQPIT